MTPTPRSARPRAGEIDVGTVPPSGRAAAGSPRGSRRPRRRGLPLRLVLASPATDWTGRRPPRNSGAGDGSGSLFRSIEVSVLPAGCGAGQPRWLPRPLVSGQVGAGKGPARGKPRAGSVVGPPRVFDNPVVGHASISNSRVCVVVASNQSLYERAGRRRALLSREGTRRPAVEEWAARTVARRRGPRHRREVCIASRRSLRRPGPSGPGSARRSGRRGQAPKGTGWMPRRHPSFGRGRLRNVRGSCPTSVDPGIPETTEGTETSQYLQEQKATAIPSVAASERGTA